MKLSCEVNLKWKIYCERGLLHNSVDWVDVRDEMKSACRRFEQDLWLLKVVKQSSKVCDQLWKNMWWRRTSSENILAEEVRYFQNDVAGCRR